MRREKTNQDYYVWKGMTIRRQNTRAAFTPAEASKPRSGFSISAEDAPPV